jgi:hypothetical protein
MPHIQKIETAISKAEQHNGKLSFHNAPDLGTTFSIEMPVQKVAKGMTAGRVKWKSPLLCSSWLCTEKLHAPAGHPRG